MLMAKLVSFIVCLIYEKIIMTMARVQSVSRMSEKVATGILTGVIKVSGYFTRSVANSKVGKKVIGLIPGEIVLASLDGFGR